MRTLLLTICLLIACASMSSGQASRYQVKSNDDIAQFLDPKYPRYVADDPKDPEHKKWRKAMDRYAGDHPPFPEYKNTGDVAGDENVYALAIENWFMRNLYYPQYIDTGNPAVDLQNWTKAKNEWCKRYPEECKKVDAAR